MLLSLIKLLTLLGVSEMMSPSDYCKYFIGVHYSFGGKTPEQGFDCSGLVSEGLKAAGLIPNAALLNSQMLYNRLLHLSIHSEIKKDSLLFFGEDITKITHVALALDNKFLIESSGEGRVETDKGFVRIRPINHRNDLVGVLNL